MVSENILRRQTKLFRSQLGDALSAFGHIDFAALDDEAILGFLEDLRGCPVRQTGGGGGGSAAMLVWAITRVFNPTLIVESGVYRGFTSWVLRRAQPDAEITSFDISLSELKYRVESVAYCEHDWMRSEIRADKEVSSLIYFDDHVNQWMRIQQAAQRGFRYLLFDDSLPVVALHNDGMAAAPTVDMLFDDGLEDGELITWVTECGTFNHVYSESDARDIRKLVRRYVRLPHLRDVFGYSPANLVLVEVEPSDAGPSR